LVSARQENGEKAMKLKEKILFLTLIVAVILICTVPRVEAQVTYNTSIIANTNGADTYTYVQIPTVNITEILNGGLNITYQSVGLGTTFLASYGERYDIITENPVNTTPYDPIIVNSTIIIGDNEVYDGGGRWYERGPGIEFGDWMFSITGDNATIRNCRFNYTDFANSVSLGVLNRCNNSTIEYCEIWNCGTYGFSFHGANNSRIHHNYFNEIQYAGSDTGVRNYNNTFDYNVICGPDGTMDRNGYKAMQSTGLEFSNNIVHITVGNNNTSASTRAGVLISPQYDGVFNMSILNNTFIGYPGNNPSGWENGATSCASIGISQGDVASTNITSSGNIFANIWRGIHCIAGTSGLYSTNDTVINYINAFANQEFYDQGANNFTGSVIHDEPYYTDFPWFAGAYGEPLEVYRLEAVPGDGIHYGLTPSVYTLYTLDISWVDDDTGVYFYIGGNRIQIGTSAGAVKIYAGTQDGTVFSWTDAANSSRAYMKILVDTRSGGATLYWPGDDEGQYGRYYPSYYNKFQLDMNAHKFTPTHFTILDRGTSVSTLHLLKQEIYINDFAVAIGSNKHQGLGFDGVRTPSTLYEGLEDIQALGFNATLFMDDGYISNNTWTTYLKNTDLELGQHFNPTTLTSIDNTEFEGNVTAQNNTIATLWDKQPKMYAVLGVGWLTNVSRVQWMAHEMDMIQRAGRMVKATPTSEALINSSFPYLDNGTVLGYAVSPLYGHETDEIPNDSGSITPVYWNIWINHLQVGLGTEVIVTGYYDWYMVNSNQYSGALDASFIYSTAPAGAAVYPTASQPTRNTTVIGYMCRIRSTFTDTGGLSHYIFSYDNGTGTYVNGTLTAIVGAPLSSVTDEVVKLNTTVGTTIRAIYYVNNTVDNWDASPALTFTTTAVPTTSDIEDSMIETFETMFSMFPLIVLVIALSVVEAGRGGMVDNKVIGFAVMVALVALMWVVIQGLGV